MKLNPSPALLVLLAACAPVHRWQVDYGNPTALPIVHPSNDRERWYVVADLGEPGEHVFFFDTGYGTTTCDDDFVALLGLSPRGQVRVRGEAGTVEAGRVKLPPITLGGHTLNNVWCLVRDLNATSSIRDPGEVAIAGVLGADVLSPFVAEIDPTEPHVLLHNPKTRDPLPRQDSLRMRREAPFSSRRTLPTGVGPHIVHPVIDTGAAGTYLDGEQLDLRVVDIRRDVLVRGSGLTGEVRMDLTTFEATLTLGATSLDGVRITSRTSAPLDDGLLGLNVLANHLQIYDFPRGRAQLIAVEKVDVPSWREHQSLQSTPPERPLAP